MSERSTEAGDDPATAQQAGETADGQGTEGAPPDAGGETPEDGQSADGQTPEDGEGPDGGIGAGVVTLGILLVLVISLANVAIAVDSTVLDEDHVVETMDDEGVFSAVTEEARESTAEGINDSIDDQQREFMPPDTHEQIEEIATDAVTESYIREEMSRNIDKFYAYLHDEESDIHLAIDFTEPRENAIADIEERGLDQYIDTDAVRNELPDERNLTPNGEPPEGMDDAQTAVSIIGWLTILMPLLALGLVGVIYYLTNSVQRTANTSGTAILVAGVIGLLIGYVVGGIASDGVESAFGAEEGIEASFSDGFVALVASLFDTIAWQSLILAVAGVVVLGLAFADREGYLDGLKGDDEADAGDPPDSTDEYGGETDSETDPSRDTER